jgi:hypothetical protein
MEPEKFQSYDNAVKAYLEIRDQQRLDVGHTAMVEQQVRESFLQEVQNMDHLLDLFKKSQDLLEQVQVFREKASELRLRTKTKNSIRRLFTGLSLWLVG